MKKVTGKSDGDVDDVVTRKGEGKEKKRRLLRILVFLVPLTEEKDIVHSLFFVRKNFIKNLIKKGRGNFVMEKVVKS